MTKINILKITQLFIALLGILQCSDKNSAKESFWEELKKNSSYSWEQVAIQWKDISNNNSDLAGKYESKAEN